MERVKFNSTGIKDKEKIYEILRKEGYSVYEWYDSPGTYYPTHTHPDREIRWVIEGEVVIGAEGKEFVLKEGDMIELEPNTPHWAKTEKGVRYICGSK
ncbi:cupin domain-containing protein [Aquifex aeolicus]|uniref:cupin domain-containing protein n=1 Tax=Aquifex aeolicus TaxID=63363 RepID=UPI00031B56A4|nr:cupin domain-containing protein [Aquifex aeolicus]